VCDSNTFAAVFPLFLLDAKHNAPVSDRKPDDSDLPAALSQGRAGPLYGLSTGCRGWRRHKQQRASPSTRPPCVLQWATEHTDTAQLLANSC